MAYADLFNLLGINESGFGSGDGGYREQPPRNVQGWADKSQIDENSSIGQHQRDTYAEQMQSKMEDQARHNYNKENGHDAWNDLSQSDQQKELDKQKSEGKIDDPSKHSSDSSRERQNREQQDKDNARDAVRDYVKDQEKKAKDSNESWTHDDAEAARKSARDNLNEGKNADGSSKNGEKTDDESNPQTQDKAAEKENIDNSGATDNSSNQLSALELQVQWCVDAILAMMLQSH